MGEQSLILPRAFREADPGIDDDLVPRDARTLGCFDTACKFSCHLQGDVVVNGLRVHRLWRAAHVHQHHGTASAGDQRSSMRVMGQAGDVVDDGSAGIQRRRHGRRVPRVH